MNEQYVALSCCLPTKQMSKSKQCKVPTKECYTPPSDSPSTIRPLAIPRHSVLVIVKGRCLTTPRSSKLPSPGFADVIPAEIEVSERWALRQHSCKTLCPSFSNPIAVEIEVSQCCTLRQYSYKTLCTACPDHIPTEIEVS